MKSSPDLIDELRASRPTAPVALRARVREIAAQDAVPKPSPWPRLRLPLRTLALVAVPAAAAVAIASAGVLGLVRSDGAAEALREQSLADKSTPDRGPYVGSILTRTDRLETTQGSPVAPAQDRAQRISATLTVEVADSDGVSVAAQKALDLTKSLGGYVVSSSVTTGDEGSASLTVRIPVGRVQQAIVQLSGLGRIVSQQVQIDDLQESLDALERRERSVRSQIALLVARLDSESLDAATRVRLEARLKTLRDELRDLRRGISATNAEARMATIQLSVVTPGTLGAVSTSTRLDRTLDDALDVLVWEGVIALAIAIVAAPFALVAFAVWLGRRFYRRREEERLLAT